MESMLIESHVDDDDESLASERRVLSDEAKQSKAKQSGHAWFRDAVIGSSRMSKTKAGGNHEP
jgi:hypothetical protein